MIRRERGMVERIGMKGRRVKIEKGSRERIVIETKAKETKWN